MSIENLIFLLFVVFLPLIEWLGRRLRERQARGPRVEPQAPAPRPAGGPARTPARIPPPPPMPMPVPVPVPPMRTAAPPPAKPRPRQPARPSARPAAPPARTAQLRRRRFDARQLRGRDALRRAMIARVVLGPCRADAPFVDVDR